MLAGHRGEKVCTASSAVQETVMIANVPVLLGWSMYANGQRILVMMGGNTMCLVAKGEEGKSRKGSRLPYLQGGQNLKGNILTTYFRQQAPSHLNQDIRWKEQVIRRGSEPKVP